MHRQNIQRMWPCIQVPVRRGSNTEKGKWTWTLTPNLQLTPAGKGKLVLTNGVSLGTLRTFQGRHFALE